MMKSDAIGDNQMLNKDHEQLDEQMENQLGNSHFQNSHVIMFMLECCPGTITDRWVPKKQPGLAGNAVTMR